MDKKITIRLKDIEDEWNDLSKYINGTRSEFIRQCILDRVHQKDELTELRKDYSEKKSSIDIQKMELKELEQRIADLEKQQELNVQNSILVNELLDIARNVAENEGLTEQRIITIAQDKIDYRILKKRLKDEGIRIYDDKHIDKDFNKNKDGEVVKTRDYTLKEKTPAETLVRIFNRHFKTKSRGKSPMDYLESEREHFEKILEKYEEWDYNSFKKEINEYYKRKGY